MKKILFSFSVLLFIISEYSLAQNTAESYYSKGFSLMNNKNYDRAIDFFDQAIELDPNNIDAYFYRGGSKAMIGQNTASIEDYLKVIDIDKNWKNIHLTYYLLGCNYINLKQDEKAIYYFDKALLNQTSLTSIVIKCAYSYRGIAKVRLNNDIDGAFIDFDAALKMDSLFFLTHLYIGMVYDKIEHIDEAVKNINKSIELNPQYCESYGELGDIKKNKLKDYQGAIENYSKAISLCPNYRNYYWSRAGAYGQNGDYTEAISDYTKSISLSEPNSAETASMYLWRGYAKTLLNDQEESIKDFYKVLEINPNHEHIGYLYHYMGSSYTELGEGDSAIKYFNKSAELKINSECLNSEQSLDEIQKLLSKKLTTNIYPNPIKEKAILYLRLDEFTSITALNLKFIDVLGKEALLIGNISSEYTEINRGNLKTGIYQYVIEQNGRPIKTGKIVIE